MRFSAVSHVFLVIITLQSAQGQQSSLINGWVNRIGRELWNLAQMITKSAEIESRYASLNAQIEKKDPEKLLQEIVTGISRMMDRKMDAIGCIAKTAESAAKGFNLNSSEPFSYYSSKYSLVEGEEEPPELPDSIAQNHDIYRNMTVNNDTHFYNLPVNTNYSSVHVPVNIYDKHLESQVAIQWSEALDDIFRQNYKSDPALSWQYFGSSTGIMRHYPAMRWKVNQEGGGMNEGRADTFDCRVRTWFIEATTCTKDVVILLDNSGSMQGMGKHIASFTVSSILQTLSNNDYLNILSYNNSVKFVVPCFENRLVQATKENIEVFMDAIVKLQPDEKSNLVRALEKAFQLLANYREKRGCGNLDVACNQAIMLVSDGVPADLTPIINRYNHLSNGTSIPVRIFTYLIGKEVTNADELRSMACSNRGYYAKIQALGQVMQSVFQYIPVMARPLVLSWTHPKSWTHAYTDITYDDTNDDQINEPYRLLTSVAVPAFELKENLFDNTTAATLLGVAATDVPLDDIEKLTLPYKIGVLGYAFIVSNNGYVLMHPDLRPVHLNLLKTNYNSVDLTEVEQMDIDSHPRDLGPENNGSLKQLRSALVKGDEGSLTDIPLKLHYDDMRRISKQKYNYYFAPLERTAFSIGIALPNTFGQYFLKVDDEIRKNKHMGVNITDFFEGKNWKIHPKWVYCRYHYLEGHEFKSPEEELQHFIKKIDDDNTKFKWRHQYEANEEMAEGEDSCGRKTLGNDDYYCDEQLMQRLVFDAKNTNETFKQPLSYNSEREQALAAKYNATLRFVATMSGLTRWEHIGVEDNENETDFGDLHSRAIDETWYKSAILQHQLDKHSFVYSVPFEIDDYNNIPVTGSYAIFPKDSSMEAPGSVVGFQFSHKHFHAVFQNYTSISKASCPDCFTCNQTSDVSCYLLDSSGYVVLSYSTLEDTGKFFGEVQPVVMDTMLNMSFFEKVTIYDFQALCLIHKIEKGENITERRDVEEICEKQIDLFVLSENATSDSVQYVDETKRPFYIGKIPKSSLVLVVVENTPITEGDHPKFMTSPQDIVYDGVKNPCHKLILNDLERRPLGGCFNEHPVESTIKECGKANQHTANTLLVLLSAVVVFINKL